MYPQRKDSLLDFKDQSRNVRLLKICTYNGKKALNKSKESILSKEAQSIQFEYDKNKDTNLMQIFKDNLQLLLIYLRKKYFEENVNNEKLKEEKNILLKQIAKMDFRIEKLLNLFEQCLESKSFLLCVKECSLDIKNFSRESQLDIIYDFYKLFKYQNQFYKMGNSNNKNQFKKWLYTIIQNIKLSDNINDSRYINHILTSIDMNNFSNIFKRINNNYIKNHMITNIFESLNDFQNTFLNIQSSVKLSFDNLVNSNDKVNELKNEIINELKRKNKIQETFNLIKDKYYLFSDKLNIAKTIYDNSSNNKICLKNKLILTINFDKINEKLNLIINRIVNYNSNDMKKLKFERSCKNVVTTLDKIRYIEKVMNFLILYKKEQKYFNIKNYEKVMKEFKKEQYIRKFRNKEKILKRLHDLKIKKIIDKKSKIYFLPFKK